MSAPEDNVMQRAVMDIASARLPLTPIAQGSYARRYNGRNSGFLAYALGQFHHQRFVTATRRARRMPARLSRYLRASCHGGKRSRDRSRRRSGPPDYPRNPLYQGLSVPGTNLLESAHPPPAQALRAQRRRQIRAYRLGRRPRYHRPRPAQRPSIRALLAIRAALDIGHCPISRVAGHKRQGLAAMQGLDLTGGASGTRTPDLRIMIPSL